jgi:hypothetical protein
MQEFNDYIKRPNLRIMNIEEGEEVQANGIHNIFSKIITEISPNIEKTMPIQVQEASRTPNRLDQNYPTTYYHQNNKHRVYRKILKAVKKKKTNNI